MKDKSFHEVVSEKFITSWQDITKFSKPIVAAVNGYAVHFPRTLPTTALTGHKADDSSWAEGVNWR